MNKKRKLCYTIENHIGNINPYRSYYYDTETKLYYLNSRYYNPLWGRFINADEIVGANRDILSYNLYAYCSNNPTNMIDPNGDIGFVLGCMIIGAVAGALAGSMIGAAKSKAKKGKVSKKSVVKGAVKGAVVGSVVGLTVGTVTSKIGVKPKVSPSNGYNSFNQLKKNMPTPKPGNQIHHIVKKWI